MLLHKKCSEFFFKYFPLRSVNFSLCSKWLEKSEVNQDKHLVAREIVLAGAIIAGEMKTFFGGGQTVGDAAANAQRA